MDTAAHSVIQKKAAYVRLATKDDVPAIKLLIQGLADYEGLSKECYATEAALASTLFLQPAFLGTTVLLLELAPLPEVPFPAGHRVDKALLDITCQEAYHEVSLTCKVEEDEFASQYRSSKDGTRTLVGFALFFPRYVCYMAKNAIFLEGLHVRQAYRRQGLGTLLLKTVAQEAVKRGFGRLDWIVEDWNVNATKFYEATGAVIMPKLLNCRLKGENLQAYGS